MKPETPITISWGASTPRSGTLKAYEVRYTGDGGAHYTVYSSSIPIDSRKLTFTPIVRKDQTLQVQVCAINSYNKKSSYATFTPISIYADGMSIGKIDNGMKHVRGYIKVNGQIKKVESIKVKVNGRIYSIDQYLSPLNTTQDIYL